MPFTTVLGLLSTVYLVEVREMSNRQTYYEWFEWPSEQFERERKHPAIPVYRAFRDWKE